MVANNIIDFLSIRDGLENNTLNRMYFNEKLISEELPEDSCRPYVYEIIEGLERNTSLKELQAALSTDDAENPLFLYVVRQCTHLTELSVEFNEKDQKLHDEEFDVSVIAGVASRLATLKTVVIDGDRPLKGTEKLLNLPHVEALKLMISSDEARQDFLDALKTHKPESLKEVKLNLGLRKIDEEQNLMPDMYEILQQYPDFYFTFESHGSQVSTHYGAHFLSENEEASKKFWALNTHNQNIVTSLRADNPLETACENHVLQDYIKLLPPEKRPNAEQFIESGAFEKMHEIHKIYSNEKTAAKELSEIVALCSFSDNDLKKLYEHATADYSRNLLEQKIIQNEQRTFDEQLSKMFDSFLQNSQ